jgi:uncharacterized protein (DUF2141 family)
MCSASTGTPRLRALCRVFQTVLVLWVFGTFCHTHGALADDSVLSVSISGLKPQGRLFGQVFADAASFKAKTGGVATFTLAPSGSPTLHTALSLPPGRYAIAMFQDTKGTGRLETNILGIPSVPYGFSNNATGGIGPPDFEAAAFALGHQPMTLSIELR